MPTPNTASATHVADEQPWYKERSIWRDVPMDQWNDWHWQMRNRISSAEELARVIPMTPLEQRTI